MTIPGIINTIRMEHGSIQLPLSDTAIDVKGRLSKRSYSMLTASSYDLTMYVIDTLMEEDPPLDSPLGKLLRNLSLAAKEYEKILEKIHA